MDTDREPTYRRLLDLLGDQSWHSLAEIRTVTYYPAEWIAELRQSGHAIEEDHDRYRLHLGD